MSSRQVRQPFQAADMGVASQNCRVREQSYTTACPCCTMRVVLHCSDCKVQVTGCLCTEYARFGEDEAWKRAVARWGEDAARKRAEQAGLWVPPAR